MRLPRLVLAGDEDEAALRFLCEPFFLSSSRFLAGELLLRFLSFARLLSLTAFLTFFCLLSLLLAPLAEGDLDFDCEAEAAPKRLWLFWPPQ